MLLPHQPWRGLRGGNFPPVSVAEGFGTAFEKTRCGGGGQMIPVLGLLFLMLSPAAGDMNPGALGGALTGAAFDQQLERSTQLAIEGKTVEAVAFLHEPGFLLAADHEGHTALFAAAVACNTSVLDQVLMRSPKLNHRAPKGATAL